MKKQNIKESQALAAKARAMILSYLNRNQKRMTIKEIVSELSDKFNAAGIRHEAINYQMSRLAANNLVGSVRRGTAIEYFRNPSNELVVVEDVPVKTTRKYNRTDIVQQPALAIDIVKSTGKVRINMNGMVIEIGIVD